MTLIIKPKPQRVSNGLPKHFHIHYLFKAHPYGICIPDEQKFTGTLTNIIWKEQEENQPLMPVNKCFPEFLSYSLIPDPNYFLLPTC